MPSSIIAALLAKRGIKPEDQERFLHPDFDRDTHDPFLMKGMKQAVERIQQALVKNERIAVYGDYDADGVPATAVMVRGLAGLGIEVLPMIPTRAAGYGLTMEAVADIIDSGATLLITVDNGTVSQKEISALKAAGIDTIVCDHHEPQEGHIAEDALAILNPKQKDCPYPFGELCGCAIGWKLMQALYEAEGKPAGSLKWLLDLVAFSTIADMVPLLGENRVLALYGLRVLRKTRNRGLQALAAAAAVNLAEIGSGGVSFYMAPRINAPSRMHQEMQEGNHVSLRLLITEDENEAKQLAEFLHLQNAERQQLLDAHLEEAERQMAFCSQDYCLVLFESGWSSGVIGLVAGRMLERYQRPVVVLAPEGEVVKGSVRSVDGIHAVDMLQGASDFLEKFGGHSKAAGLSLKQGIEVQEVRKAINEWMQKQGRSLEDIAEAARKQADMELTLEDCNLDLAKELILLEPFGIGFPSPLFKVRAEVTAVRGVGSRKQHLACFLEQGPIKRKAIGFGLADQEIIPRAAYDILCSIELEEWNGQQSASCHIKRLDLASTN